jgi:hypothetical protein
MTATNIEIEVRTDNCLLGKSLALSIQTALAALAGQIGVIKLKNI